MVATRSISKLVDLSDWTSDGLNRFQPQPPALVATGDPRDFDNATGLGTDVGYGARVLVPRTGTLRDLTIFVGNQAGNISVAVYSTAATRVRLYSTGSIACPPVGWALVGDPALAVTAGDQLDFAVSTDSVSFAVVRKALASVAQGQLPIGFWPAAGGAAPKIAWYSTPPGFPLPATLPEASLNSNSVVPLIIARVA